MNGLQPDSKTSRLPNVRGEYKFSESLKKYTWLNIGGPAEIMFFPEDAEDLRYFMQHKDANLSAFVIGGGSNLLVRDGGISGVVIKLKNQNFAQVSLQDNILKCGAGALNASLKKIITDNGLGGLEFLCSIPGSIGGLVRTNAGCFGKTLSDVLISAQVMDCRGDIFTARKDDFHFGYRHSNFPSDWIILEVSLQFEQMSPEIVAANVKENDNYRQQHQPQGIRTAGSTFKNPMGYRAWELIKNSGGNTISVGGARMSPQHCNFLENDGTATAADVENLGKKIIESVKKQTGVDLEWEIKIVGQEQKIGR
ncbi:MAG: UDP-N-acetylmuramate dehydrogenase [Alphaproteobacteria bacterium]|nr:UDP-N-acetylmuramate dehydrogenase [Alphaproteobacteria bacterium]